MQLRELQKNFASFIDNADRVSVLSVIKENDSLTSSEGMGIYQASVQGGLKKALKEIYPVVGQITGERLFNKVMQDYIETYPCYQKNLDEYGEYLAELLVNYPWLEELEFLPDLARLEWAWHCAVNESDFKQTDSTSLKKRILENSDIRINFVPTLTVLQSSFPVLDIWLAHQSDSDNMEIELKQDYVEYLAVWRDVQNHLFIRPIGNVEFALITVLQIHHAPAIAIQEMQALYSEQKIIIALGSLLQQNLFADGTI